MVLINNLTFKINFINLAKRCNIGKILLVYYSPGIVRVFYVEIFNKDLCTNSHLQ